MIVDEKRARQILLAQAIETADTQGKLISDVERDELDRRAIEETRSSGAVRPDIGAALCARAARVLEIVARRDAGLASLQDAPTWRQSLVWGLPLLALLLGILTDQVANPHRVDLLSLPLLAIVLWNLAIYVALAIALLRKAGHAGDTTDPALGGIRRLAARFVDTPRQSGRTRAEIRARFLVSWQTVAARLNGQRVTMVLHLAAAAWGAGVALSLFIRGLVVEYKIGWESTFLSAEQVRAWLTGLFRPVLALFSMAPFTLSEISAMRFDAGNVAATESGRRWVYLYAGLLLIVVIIPRLALAAFAWARVKLAARRLSIDLSESYFQQLIDRLIPARVKLWVQSHRDADRQALSSVLQQHAERNTGDVLMTTPTGDALQLAMLSSSTALTTPGGTALSTIRARLFGPPAAAV